MRAVSLFICVVVFFDAGADGEDLYSGEISLVRLACCSCRVDAVCLDVVSMLWVKVMLTRLIGWCILWRQMLQNPKRCILVSVYVFSLSFIVFLSFFLSDTDDTAESTSSSQDGRDTAGCPSCAVYGSPLSHTHSEPVLSGRCSRGWP